MTQEELDYIETTIVTLVLSGYEINKDSHDDANRLSYTICKNKRYKGTLFFHLYDGYIVSSSFASLLRSKTNNYEASDYIESSNVKILCEYIIKNI